MILKLSFKVDILFGIPPYLFLKDQLENKCIKLLTEPVNSFKILTQMTLYSEYEYTYN